MLAIQFYPSGDGGPVRDYLESIRTDARKKSGWIKLMRDLAFLEVDGLACKAISLGRVAGIGGSVWALRRTHQGIRYRIYFCVWNREAWLLHHLEKKSPKIPSRDMQVIRRRAREVFSR